MMERYRMCAFKAVVRSVVPSGVQRLARLALRFEVLPGSSSDVRHTHLSRPSL